MTGEEWDEELGVEEHLMWVVVLSAEVRQM
jgi:hypothetical protein